MGANKIDDQSLSHLALAAFLAISDRFLVL